MKKIYLSLALSGIVLGSSAQQLQKVSHLRAADVEPGTAEGSFKGDVYYQFEKASGDSIFYEDFASGITGWTTGGAQDIWAYDTDGPNGQFSTGATPLQSTTAANGFIIYDADGNQTPSPAGGFFNHVGFISSPVIDFTGFTNLTLAFQHTYRTCCAQGFFPKVLISDDGFSTFTELNAGISGAAVNTQTPTTITKLDLSTFIAGSTALNNVQIRFLFDGSAGTSHYFWSVDDIAVIESLENDLKINKRFLASGTQKIPYHYVPTSQLVDVELSGKISNIGLNTQNNVQLEVLVDDGTTQSTLNSLTGTSLAPGVTDSLVTSTNWMPSGAAGTTFNMFFSAVQTETEQEGSDNLITETFNITDSVYSVDNGILQSSISNFSGNANQAFKIGNQMEVMSTGDITSVSVYVANRAASAGQEIFAEIYVFDGTDFVYAADAPFYVLTNADLGTFVTLPLSTMLPVAAGDIILVMAGHQGSGDPNVADVRFGQAQKVDQGIVVGAAADGVLANLIDPNAVMVRVNMPADASVSQNEFDNLKVSQNFPNPFSNQTVIQYTLENASEVNYSLVDLTGKVVLEVNEGNVNAGGHSIKIDGSTLSNGVYYFNMTAGDTKVTRKLVVNK
ncbi:MAG: T9SS type A sorting domain-containing protein [Brumimicrobium sp.]|nr:T9SS type A sorting domain-containing protein [Brumimicrobium sp.]